MKRLTLSVIALSALLIWAMVSWTLKADATSLTTAPGFQEVLIPAGPGRTLRSLALSQTTVLGGNPVTGTVRLEFLAPRGGTLVRMSTDPPAGIEGENLAFPPPQVEVPQGETSSIFTIITNPVQSTRQVAIIAKAGGVTKTVILTITAVQVASLVIAPPAGLGPFQATGTATLNVSAPGPGPVTVALTSSNPDVVRFGTLISSQATMNLTFQPGERVKTFPLIAQSVLETTTVSISTTLNGNTVTRPIVVRR